MKNDNYVPNMFIKGPIDIKLLGLANKIKCIDVLLVIWLQSSMERSFIVHLKPSLFEMMGIERTKRYRAIKKLESVGLVVVIENKIGKACTVELVRENLGRFLPF
jgi:hypothetical protein